MRKFILATGLFSAGFIALNLLLYFFVFHPLLYKDYIVGKNTLDDYKYFIFSDSHGRVIKQEFLGETGIYNFSYASDSYKDMFFKLKFVLDKGIRPEAIIVTADDHTLSKYRDNYNNKERSIYYSTYRSFSNYYPTGYVSYLYRKYPYRYLPMLNSSNSGLFNKYFLAQFDKKDDQVIRPQKTWKEKKNKRKKCIERKKVQYANEEVSGEMTGSLLDIIKLCRENNIKLYGVKFPLTKKYIEILEGASYHADSVFMSQGLAIIEYQDYFTDHDSLFLDHDHLNANGALKFVELLRTDLKNSSLSERKR